MTNFQGARRSPGRMLLVLGAIGLLSVVAVFLGPIWVRASLGWTVSHVGPALGAALGWLGQRLTDFITLRLEAQVVVIQTFVLIFGGAWVFSRFRIQRMNEPTLRILGSARLSRRTFGGSWFLFVRVHVVNISGVNLDKVR